MALSAAYFTSSKFVVQGDYREDWVAGTKVRLTGAAATFYSSVLEVIQSGQSTIVEVKTAVVPVDLQSVSISVTSGPKGGLPEHSHTNIDTGGLLDDYEVAGTANGVMNLHTTNHPIPTNRDARNEAAGVAASVMGSHIANHPAPTSRDVRNEEAGTANSIMGSHTTNHPIPTTRDSRNEAAGVAASTMAAHTDNHPAPTTRDSRNEAAGVAASVMSSHTSNHPAPTTRDTRNCADDDSRLSDARQASDVYAWAKEATKPAYNLSEIAETETLKTVTVDEKTAWNGKEPGLGNPLVDDYVLSSKIDGTRNWRSPGARILAGRIPFGNGDEPLASDANFVYKDNKFGIGLENPASIFDLYSTNASGDTLNFKNSQTKAYMFIGVTNNSNKQLAMIAYGDKHPGTMFGVARGGSAVVLGFNSVTSLLIGTYTAAPVVFGRFNAEAMRIGGSNYIGVGTTAPSTLFHVNGPVRVGSYTVATAPSASSVGAGTMIYVTDDVGGAVGALSDGTNWRRTTDRAIVSTT